MALPDGFIPLRDVLNCNEKTCFIGAITKIQAPIPVDKVGQDHEIHFVIQDKFPGDGKDSVACILKHKKACLPTGDPGDIAILRGMKVEILGDKNTKTLVMASGFHSQALFFPSETIPASGGASKVLFRGMTGSQPPNDAEQMAVVKMKATAASLLEELKDPKVMFLARLGSKAANAKREKRQSLIGNMTFNLFYDLVGEVVKTFWDGDCVDLYITDYTTNKDLFLYEDKSQMYLYSGDKRPWPGPFGQMTMQIRCYEPHAGVARELKEGDFVFMQNIRTKWSQTNKLEGAIHQDLQYPNKIGVRKCTHKLQLGDLIERKAEYEKKRAATLLADGDSNAPKKPPAIASSKKKLTKAQKRRLQKEQDLKELENKGTEKEKPIKGINNNVCAGDKDVGLSTVDEIVNNPHLKLITEHGNQLALPFVNSRYRARLRVVDHWPTELENFCRCTNTPETSQASASASSNGGSQLLNNSERSERFKWHFFLLVEDADAPKGSTPIRFPLTIDTSRAQCLLKMDPCDLSARTSKLCELKEKLFVLWGNLHERKIALKKEGIDLPLNVGDEKFGLSNLPFECCIEEYGVPVNDRGIPYTDDEIRAFVKCMSQPDTEEGRAAMKIVGNPKTWKRTWSPYNTTIKMDA